MARGGTQFVGSGPAVSRAGGSGPRFVGFGGPSVPPVITRVTPAVIGPYVAGDLPTDAYVPGTYFSTATNANVPGDEGSVGAAWTVNGTAWDEVTALAEGDEVRLTETVQDDADPVNSRPFTYGPVSVPFAAGDVPANAVTLDGTEATALSLDGTADGIVTEDDLGMYAVLYVERDTTWPARPDTPGPVVWIGESPEPEAMGPLDRFLEVAA
jgi:hypothetical protein